MERDGKIDIRLLMYVKTTFIVLNKIMGGSSYDVVAGVHSGYLYLASVQLAQGSGLKVTITNILLLL